MSVMLQDNSGKWYEDSRSYDQLNEGEKDEANQWGRGSSGGSSGGGGGGGGGSDEDKIREFARLTSGFSVKELEEKKRQFDAELVFRREEMERIGIPRVQIEQQLADMRKEQEAWARGHAERTFRFEQDMARAGLSMDVLKYAAQLSGPQDWIKAARFNRGVAGAAQAGVPFLQNLLGNIQTAVGGNANDPGFNNERTIQGTFAAMGAGGGAPAQPAPQVGWLNQVAAGSGGSTLQAANAVTGGAQPGMVYAGGTPNFDESTGQYITPPTPIQPVVNPEQAAAENMVRRLYERGFQSFAPGVLESMSPTEQKMLMGAGADLGYDVDTEMDKHARSRILQRAALPS